MKNFYVCLLMMTPLLSSARPLQHPDSAVLHVLMFGAHPDDCDINGGGTAALFASMGHAVKFISLTNGDAGHQTDKGPSLAARRYAEAQEAAKILGITYEVLNNHDGELMPTLELRREIIRKIREWKADIVIAPRPNDYHPDHRYTGVLVQDAAYLVAVPNIVPEVPALSKNPVFLYFQDRFQRPNPFRADIAIDISLVFDKKIDALNAHESQVYEWLPWIGHYSDQVPKNKSERRNWLAHSRAMVISQDVRNTLSRWYGPERAQKVVQAEAFEICEYGSQPDFAEIRRLFPMLTVH